MSGMTSMMNTGEASDLVSRVDLRSTNSPTLMSRCSRCARELYLVGCVGVGRRELVAWRAGVACRRGVAVGWQSHTHIIAIQSAPSIFRVHGTILGAYRP